MAPKQEFESYARRFMRIAQMKDSDCVEYARDCARLATLTTDEQIREQLLQMAREWMAVGMSHYEHCPVLGDLRCDRTHPLCRQPKFASCSKFELNAVGRVVVI